MNTHSPTSTSTTPSAWKADTLDTRVFAVILIAMFTLTTTLPLLGANDPGPKRLAKVSFPSTPPAAVVAKVDLQQR